MPHPNRKKRVGSSFFFHRAGKLQLGISPNTLKYHNKNIYSKLGISSRKQMLRFAALKQHRDTHGKTS